MTIEVFQEEVVGLGQAAGRLRKTAKGKRVCTSTLYRWAQRGLVGIDGRRYRLETVKVGRRTCTSIEALQRFLDNLSSEPPVDAREPRSSKRRLRQIQRANEELDRAGI